MNKVSFTLLLENKGILKPRYEDDGYTPTESYQKEVECAGQMLEAFEKISDCINSFSDKSTIFNEAVICGMGHRTLEQTFNSLIFKYIQFLASDEYKKRTDGRNIQGHEVAKMLMEAFKQKEGFDFIGNLSCI